jgi:hypothetical protein
VGGVGGTEILYSIVLHTGAREIDSHSPHLLHDDALFVRACSTTGTIFGCCKKIIELINQRLLLFARIAL